MAKRESIHIKDFVHKNPIPNASRIGNIVVSGALMGRDPETDKPGATLADQCRLIFLHMKSTVEAAGGTTDDIIKVTVWLKDASDRAALNDEWVKMFPDPESRPARHVQNDTSDNPYLVHCDFMAVL
jgi:enamine deaminase RidA (YjgF/YER057c/UK114 family)